MMIGNNFNIGSINGGMGWGNNTKTNSFFPSNNGFFGLGKNNAATSMNFRSSLLGIASSANALKSSLNNMRGIGKNASSPFGNIKATSQDTKKLDIRSVDANRLRNANVKELNVDIIQTAKAQKNEGNALKSSDLAVNSGLTTGANTVSLDIGGKQYDFSFNVSDKDTVKDVQEKLAKAVNSRGLSVQASVTSDSKDGTSKLSFESKQTGENNPGQPNFTVKDTVGGSIAALGGNSVTQEAQNAQYRVNRNGFSGALQTSKSNDVDLGNGIGATLKDTGNVKIDIGADKTGQINAFRDMVNSVNDLIESARNGSSSGGRLQRELSTTIKSSSASLSRLGISVNSSGYMTIDEKKMEKAADRGDLERFASRDRVGSSSGFMNRLTRTADNVSRNPSAYVNQGNDSFSPFSFNARTMNQMNRFMSWGLLFDSFI